MKWFRKLRKLLSEESSSRLEGGAWSFKNSKPPVGAPRPKPAPSDQGTIKGGEVRSAPFASEITVSELPDHESHIELAKAEVKQAGIMLASSKRDTERWEALLARRKETLERLKKA